MLSAWPKVHTHLTLGYHQVKILSVYVTQNDKISWRRALSYVSSICFAKTSPLHEAASRGCEKICKIIIESVKDANPKDSEGSTPLHQAVINGHFDLCKLIREKAENKNPKDQRGRTPLHEAAIWGHFQIFTWIFER